jgi:hypothetical protein
MRTPHVAEAGNMAGDMAARPGRFVFEILLGGVGGGKAGESNGRALRRLGA